MTDPITPERVTLTEGEVRAAAIAGLDASWPRWIGTADNEPSKDDLIFARAAAETALSDRLRAAQADAWDEGYRQAMVAFGHVPPEDDDPSRHGPPSRGGHSNPYQETP